MLESFQRWWDHVTLAQKIAGGFLGIIVISLIGLMAVYIPELLLVLGITVGIIVALAVLVILIGTVIIGYWPWEDEPPK